MNGSAELMENVDETMQPLQASSHNAARTIAREFRNLIADVEDLTKRVAHIDDADLARTRAKLETTLKSAKAALHDGTGRAKAAARQAADTTDHYVHENPWSAVGIAAAAGAAIGVLLGARMHR